MYGPVPCRFIAYRIRGKDHECGKASSFRMSIPECGIRNVPVCAEHYPEWVRIYRKYGAVFTPIEDSKR